MTTHTFAVLLARKAEVDAALTAVVKRANRKGIPGIFTWSWGKAFEDRALVPNDPPHRPPTPDAILSPGGSEWSVKVIRIPLVVEGEVPRFQGWRFVAALQHLDGENIVRGVPGEEVPSLYRTRGAYCDHCKSIRRRNDTYVLRHDDGVFVQVGSSCLKDFLGTDEALRLASKAEMLSLLEGLIRDGNEGAFGRATERLLSEYLAVVSRCVRVLGWRSRTVANEEGGQATADAAWGLMFEKKYGDEPVTQDDMTTAKEAEVWASEISDEEVDKASSDYLHNLRAVARNGFVSSRMAGIAASMVTAYQRHVGRLRRKDRLHLNVYLGKVGMKVTFGLPPELKKNGLPKKGAPTVLDKEPVTLDFVTGYQTDYGYTTVLKFKTKEGATVVWKASNTDLKRQDVGKTYTLYGTVKAHTEYKGEKQTILSRCGVNLVEEKQL
jgi:hypothetical protein